MIFAKTSITFYVSIGTNKIINTPFGFITRYVKIAARFIH